MEAIRNLISQVLEQYTLVTELNPNSWRDSDQIETLNLAFELDDTGLSMFMLVRGLYDRFLKATTFSAKDILDDPKAFFDRTEALKKLYDLVEDSSVTSLIQEFEQKVLGAADCYLVDAEHRAALEKFLKDKYDVAQIRLAALRSMQDLQVHQFLQGEASPSPLKINNFIFEFWNINSLIAAMRGQKVDGISLCLIRDPEEVMASYFLFAIRNGENLTILTDREEGPHPMYWRMSRKPDRQMVRRWDKNWFPYELLKLDAIVDEDGHVKGYAAAKRVELVPYQTEAVRLATIGSLAPAEFMWVSLIFDRIQERYSKEQLMLPEISYTGEMVAQPDVLVGATGSLVLTKKYTPLELVPLTGKDVTRETTAHQWEYPQTGTHNWIEDRYAPMVPDEVLNPVGEPDRLRLSASHKLVTPGDRFFGVKADPLLETLSPVTFGTKEKLERDRQWVARYNQIIHMQKQVDKEHEDHAAEVLTWFKDKVEKRRDLLIKAAAAGEFMSVKIGRADFWERSNSSSEKNILHTAPKIGFYRPATIGGTFDYQNGWSCCINGARAGVTVTFRCNNAQAIADVLGVAVPDLPVWLQHYLWHDDYPYDGNCILDRLDPLDWKIKNPWDQMNFDVCVIFSRSGYNQKRKELGLPRVIFEKEKKGQ